MLAAYIVFPSSEKRSPCATNENFVSKVRGRRGSARSTAVTLNPAEPAVQKVCPSGAKPLSWPNTPERVEESSFGLRQSVRTS